MGRESQGPVRSVHLCAGDDCGWALDEDLRLLRGALSGVCRTSGLAEAEIVHSVWWYRLVEFSRRDMAGKHVLCYADNAPVYYASEPEFLKARELVTLWIARSREAVRQFAAMGIESEFAPYTVDTTTFRPLPPDDPDLRALSARWNIPLDRYLIANFHRDTESSDLASPKLQKGPDAFLEIVSRLHHDGAPIHILLAGPRQFWLRRKLAERGVPFTFLGEETGGADDLGVNVLPRKTLNVFYNIADLHLNASRWEGGPHSVLESAASRCRVISTPLGIAPDILPPECLFSNVLEACEMIRRDIEESSLATFADASLALVHEQHTESALRQHLLAIYGSLPPARAASGFFARSGYFFRRIVRNVAIRFPAKPRAFRLAILHRVTATEALPFDAFIETLACELERLGNRVIRNTLEADLDAILLGELDESDPLIVALPGHKKCPNIGFFNEANTQNEEALETQMRQRSALDECTVLPSLDAYDALNRRGLLRTKAVVLPPSFKSPLSTPEIQSKDDASVSRAPLEVGAGDPWAGTAIQSAISDKRPVLYPADSHYWHLATFAGLGFKDSGDAVEKRALLGNNIALFSRLIPRSDPAQAAGRILRLLRALRSMSAE